MLRRVALIGSIDWFTFKLADILHKNGYLVIVASQKSSECGEIGKKLPIYVYCGSRIDEALINSIGPEDLAMAIVRIDDHEQAYSIAKLLKSFGVPEVLVIADAKDSDSFRAMGVKLVSPSKLVLGYIEKLLRNEYKVLAYNDKDMEIYLVKVPEDSSLVGKTVEEVENEYGVVICSKMSEGAVIKIASNYVLQGGDIITVIGAPKRIAEFLEET